MMGLNDCSSSLYALNIERVKTPCTFAHTSSVLGGEAEGQPRVVHAVFLDHLFSGPGRCRKEWLR